MLNHLIKPLFVIFSHLSLKSAHTLGMFLGIIINQLSPKSAKNRRDNLLQSGLCTNEAILQRTMRDNVHETGKALLESLVIWATPHEKMGDLIQKVHNWQLVEAAVARGNGIIFLTPHLGCFEITSLYYALHYPISVLFRPPKMPWLTPIFTAGRARQNVSLAPANHSGVKTLLLALKRGEAIGILPDQIPKTGEGEWADFFGKPAYTMTLACKLAQRSGATVIMAFGERLADGQGFHLHLSAVDSIATPSLLNLAIEKQIAQKPEQYLWQYNRYKIRRHALKKESIT